MLKKTLKENVKQSKCMYFTYLLFIYFQSFGVSFLWHLQSFNQVSPKQSSCFSLDGQTESSTLQITSLVDLMLLC